jgi:hypothetical protein
MKTKMIIFVGIASILCGAANLCGAVQVYEGFGDAVNNASIAGYSGTSAEAGLTGTWSVTGGAEMLVSSASHDFVGIDGGFIPETTGGNQHWWHFNTDWNIARATRPLSGTIDMTVDGVWYMSFFSIAGNSDTVSQIGLNDGVNELIWGNGWNGTTWQGAQGLTAYYGVIDTSPRTNADGTGYDGDGTNFWVAKIVKSNSSTTNDLVVSIMFYDLTSSANTIDGSDPAVWTRVVSLTGVSAVFNALELKMDGGWGNQPSIDEVHIGRSWGDVTGKISYIEMNAPLNGAANIPVARTSPLNDLTFTVNDPNIVKVDVQFGLENDPNLTSGPAYKIVDGMAVTPGQYTVNLESLAADLVNDTPYYWKVIGYEPNGLGFMLLPSYVFSFTTAPATVVISAVSPAYTAVDAGQNVVLSVTGVSVDTYQWYKIGSPDVQLANGADYTGVTTNTLTILDTQSGDEGNYYCVVSNSLPSTASNRETGPGRVLTKRLTSHYPFEVMNVVDGNDVTPDVVSGFDITLKSGDTGTDKPTLDPNVVAAIVGTESLLFNNPGLTDPNTADAQFAAAKTGVVNYQDITISLWVYWKGGNNWQRIFDFGNDTTQYMFLSPNATGTNLRFTIFSTGTEQQLNTLMLETGQWMYITVTLNGSTGRLYVNGQLVDTNTAMTLNPTDLGTIVNNYIGKSQFVDPYFNGLIDDLMIYNYARTTLQIARDYLGVRGDWVCNMEVTALPYDYDGNCMISLGDFAIFAETWLESNRIYAQ